MSDQDKKLEEDEEAITSADEPMGSVAAAVPRTEGSSAAVLKKAHEQIPKKKDDSGSRIATP
jgi:hypothetical protein